MSQTLAMLYVHVVFSTKNRKSYFKTETIRKELYSYIAKIISEHDSCPIKIGGHENHIHIFFNLSKNVCLKDLIAWVKISTSKWLKTREEDFSGFYWQNGYGAFSVGEKQRSKTIDYIENQDKHHHKISFKEEFILFLKANNMNYNDKYLWD